MTKTEEKLRYELRKLFDDDDFVNGILVYAYDERDRKTLLDFIHQGVDVTVETVTVAAIDLCEQRDITG